MNFQAAFVDLGQPEGDDFLGVVEPPFASTRFARNFSQFFQANSDPLTLFPSTPFEPVLPGDAKFNGGL